MAGLESECAGLKNRLTLAEAEHKTAIAEHEKKFLQLSEEMGNKNSEVSMLDKTILPIKILNAIF